MKAYTLGPDGSCHQNACRAYFEHLDISDYEIALYDDIHHAAQEAVGDQNGIVVQCSAHLNVHLVTEHFRDTLPIIDTFIFPTQHMALLKRKNVALPRSLGIPEPAMGYVNPDDWKEIIFESTKPVVTQNLLAGKYDAGFAYSKDAETYPDQLELCETVGKVVTTWIVYGSSPRYDGRLISTLDQSAKVKLVDALKREAP